MEEIAVFYPLLAIRFFFLVVLFAPGQQGTDGAASSHQQPAAIELPVASCVCAQRAAEPLASGPLGGMPPPFPASFFLLRT